MTDRILILDFGSQVTQLIARRVRESGVYCEIFPFNVAPQRIAAYAPKGVILSGGPASVTGSDTPRAPGIVFELGRSEEHTSELQSLMHTSYAVFCLKKKKTKTNTFHQQIKPTKYNTPAHSNIRLSAI